MDFTHTDLFTPVAPAPDRRHYPRYSVHVQIEIHQENSDIPMRLETTDISRGGCYIQLMIPLQVGVRLQATLWLDGVPIIVRGLVVTRHPQFGNGIMFAEFKEGDEKLLQRYLDGIAL